jgi:hypothetical protein
MHVVPPYSICWITVGQKRIRACLCYLQLDIIVMQRNYSTRTHLYFTSAHYLVLARPVL